MSVSELSNPSSRQSPKLLIKKIWCIQQFKKRGIKSEPSLVFINSVHYFNNSSDNLVKLLGENEFYHLK